MLKYIIKITFILLIFCTNSYSEIIKKVDVTGNKRISKETILVLGNIKVDNDFTNDLLLKKISSLVTLFSEIAQFSFFFQNNINLF